MASAAAAAAAADSKTLPKRKPAELEQEEGQKKKKIIHSKPPGQDDPESIFGWFLKLKLSVGQSDRFKYTETAKDEWPEHHSTCPVCGKDAKKRFCTIRGIGYVTANKCEDDHFWWPAERIGLSEDPDWSNRLEQWLRYIGQKTAWEVLSDSIADASSKLKKRLTDFETAAGSIDGVLLPPTSETDSKYKKSSSDDEDDSD
jgi:hypothetical protein